MKTRPAQLEHRSGLAGRPGPRPKSEPESREALRRTARIGFALRLEPARRRNLGDRLARRLVLAGRIGPAFVRTGAA